MELPQSPGFKDGEKQQSLFYLSYCDIKLIHTADCRLESSKEHDQRSGLSAYHHPMKMIPKTKRAYAYANLTTAETEKLDEIAETLGYQSRTELYTAAAHILLYGDTAELIHQNKRKTEINRRMQAFFNIIDEMAFSVIAMRGIAPVYTFLLDDIRRELFNRTDAVPTDETLKHWLKIYTNINRTRLDEYCDEIRRQRYIEEEALA